MACFPSFAKSLLTSYQNPDSVQGSTAQGTEFQPRETCLLGRPKPIMATPFFPSFWHNLAGDASLA